MTGTGDAAGLGQWEWRVPGTWPRHPGLTGDAAAGQRESGSGNGGARDMAPAREVVTSRPSAAFRPPLMGRARAHFGPWLALSTGEC